MPKAKKLDVNELVDERRQAELARRKGPKQEDIVSYVKPEKGSIVNAAAHIEVKK